MAGSNCAPLKILWQITFRSSNICPTRHQQIATFQFGQFCDWFPGCYRQQGPQRCFETEAFNLHEKSKLTLDWLFQIKLLHCHSSARWWSIHMLLSVEPGNFKGKTVQFRQKKGLRWPLIASQIFLSLNACFPVWFCCFMVSLLAFSPKTDIIFSGSFLMKLNEQFYLYSSLIHYYDNL